MCRADPQCNSLMTQYSGLGGMSYVPEFQCVPNAACNALTQCREQRSAATGEQHVSRNFLRSPIRRVFSSQASQEATRCAQAHTQADMPNMIDKYPSGWCVVP